MAERKATKPLTLSQADGAILSAGLDPAAFTHEGRLILAELHRLHVRLDEIENQATEMMSPDKMMEMAQGFLGGGLKF